MNMRESVSCLFLLFLSVGLWRPVAAEVLRFEIAGASHAVPVRVVLPERGEGPFPVVVFSHGLGGSREAAEYLGEAWAAAGYLIVFVQHPGSDETVWKDLPGWRRARALKRAANPRSFLSRIEDVRTVLDYLEVAVTRPGDPLFRKADIRRMAMAGHSYGAVTTQALMGQRFDFSSPAPFHEARFDAFILMSPSPGKRLSAADAFGGVTSPVLCLTGTRDGSPIRSQVTPESRREVYAGLPPGDAYELVFEHGEHSIFGQNREHDPRYHRVIATVTTCFLDASLRGDVEARERLRSTAVRESLASGDLWSWK
jgi:dienelactone hydrolase